MQEFGGRLAGARHCPRLLPEAATKNDARWSIGGGERYAVQLFLCAAAAASFNHTFFSLDDQGSLEIKMLDNMRFWECAY